MTVAPMDWEALANACRSETQRSALLRLQTLNDEASDLWKQATATLGSCIDALCANLTNSATLNDQHASGGAEDGDDDEDGIGYTFQVDRANASNLQEPGELVAMECQVCDATVVQDHVQLATSVFRFLRNACVSCETNQIACQRAGLLPLVRTICIYSCNWIDVEDEELKSSIVLLSQVALQFGVNFCTANEPNQALVWATFSVEDLQKLLVECQEHRKIVAFAAALVLNCVNGATEEAAARRVELVCARNLVITLLQRCLIKPQAGSSTAILDIDEQDPAFEWICLLFRSLFQAGHSKDLYNAVSAHMLSRLWSRVTPEQLILLRMFTMWVTSGRPGDSISAADERVSSRTLAFLQTTWAYVTTEDDEDRPEEAEPERKAVWIALEHDAKLMLLDCMGELTLDAKLLRDPVAPVLLLSLLKELQRVWELRRSGNPMRAATNATAASHEPTQEPFGYRSGMIRVLGNMCHRHSEHQDLVRDEGYLPLFLNHCNIDDANPLIREWSLVALRNLCEGNEANQAYITALRPQGMDSEAASTEMLERARVEAEIGEDGKVKLKPKVPQ